MAKAIAKSGKHSAVAKAASGKASVGKLKVVAKAKVAAKVAAKVKVATKASAAAHTKPFKKPPAAPAGKPAASVAKARRSPAAAAQAGPPQRAGKPPNTANSATVSPVPGLTMAVTGFVAAPVPVPVAVQRELLALRDVARLLRYGEQFGGRRIEIRWLPTPLPCPSGGFTLVDPATPKSQRSFDRKVPAGAFRCMLAVAVGGPNEKLAAVILHCGRPPIARWTVAHFSGTKPPIATAQLPQVITDSGWLAIQDTATTAAVTDPAVLPPPAFTPTAMAVERRAGNGVAFAFPVGPGAYTAYWGIDEHDKAVCLVLDFNVFTQKEWRAKLRE